MVSATGTLTGAARQDSTRPPREVRMPLRNLVWLLVGPRPRRPRPGRRVQRPGPGQGLQARPPVVDVLAEVDANYVRELDRRGAAEARRGHDQRRADRLDPHSEYINAKQLKQFETRERGQASAASASSSASDASRRSG